MLGVAAARGPRVEVDHREVRRPDHLRELGDAELVGVPPGRKRDPRRLDPLRMVLRHALLVDHLAGHAFGEPPQLRRALVQRPHDPLPDRDVVLGEVALRLARLREEHLVGVRQLDDALPHLELDERARHARDASDGTLIHSRAAGSTVRGVDLTMRVGALVVGLTVLALGLAATATGGSSAPAAIPGCAIEQPELSRTGTLTLGTDNPAFPPWWGGAREEAVEGLEPGQRPGLRVGRRVRGREAARLREEAGRLDAVLVSTASFRPGKKPFDFYIAQVSYPPERAKDVDFSNSYYFVNQAVVANAGTPIASVKTVAGLRRTGSGAHDRDDELRLHRQRSSSRRRSRTCTTRTTSRSGAERTGRSTASSSTSRPRSTSRPCSSTTAKIVGQLPTRGAREHFGIVFAEGQPDLRAA